MSSQDVAYCLLRTRCRLTIVRCSEISNSIQNYVHSCISGNTGLTINLRIKKKSAVCTFSPRSPSHRCNMLRLRHNACLHSAQLAKKQTSYFGQLVHQLFSKLESASNLLLFHSTPQKHITFDKEIFMKHLPTTQKSSIDSCCPTIRSQRELRQQMVDLLSARKQSRSPSPTGENSGEKHMRSSS